jgi:hypothetical protein
VPHPIFRAGAGHAIPISTKFDFTGRLPEHTKRNGQNSGICSCTNQTQIRRRCAQASNCGRRSFQLPHINRLSAESLTIRFRAKVFFIALPKGHSVRRPGHRGRGFGGQGGASMRAGGKMGGGGSPEGMRKPHNAKDFIGSLRPPVIGLITANYRPDKILAVSRCRRTFQQGQKSIEIA